MFKFLFIFVFFGFLGAEDFISKDEYAQMLYQNPRGIGCNKCHGENGEGKAIANYKQKDKKGGEMKEHTLFAPQINNLEFSKFHNAIKKPKGMMPSYFLTDNEIQTLYEYLQALNKEQK